MKDMVSNIRDLPALPSVVMKLNSALARNDQSIDEICSIIEKDSSLTSKILRIANSSYYGLSYQVETLSRAVTILGFDTIRNIAMTVSIACLFPSPSDSGFDLRGLWHHSLSCAIASKVLVSCHHAELGEKAFICGLIHDLGHVVIFQNMPEDSMRIRKEAEHEHICSVEKEIMGFTHAEVGSLLADRWHFPPEYSSAIRYHHAPLGQTEDDTPGKIPLLTAAVHAANEISKALGLGKTLSPTVQTVDKAVWEVLGIDESLLQQIARQVSEEFEGALSSWHTS